jgi:hypothetical protein
MSQADVHGMQLAELLPWALYGAITASQYTTDVIGSAVQYNGKVVPIFKGEAENIRARIEAGEFNG